MFVAFFIVLVRIGLFKKRSFILLEQDIFFSLSSAKNFGYKLSFAVVTSVGVAVVVVTTIVFVTDRNVFVTKCSQ